MTSDKSEAAKLLRQAVDDAAAELGRVSALVDHAEVDIDFADVMLGLLARQYQLWAVLVVGPSAYTYAAYPILLRGLVDAAITISWIGKNPASAKKFKLYSAGRLKLLAEHWRALENTEPDEFQAQYAEQLEDLASSELWASLLPVELSNWNGKNIRTMAEETELKDLYHLVYSPLSAEVHAEWMVLRTRYLRPCQEQTHKSHWLPVFSLPSTDSRVPEMVTGYFILSVQTALESLDQEFDTECWETIHETIEEGVKVLVNDVGEE